jgi:phospholipase C
VQSGKLPQVSWIAAPEAYTEHPNWPANYGAWYVSQILDALTANPEVWSKTAFFLTYDENDGFFDHVVPPTLPPSKTQGKSTVDTTNEIFPGSSEYPSGPYGMGIRVPMVVISPWSKGGWVNSEVFDHTSLIRFIEERFGRQYLGIREGNITKWRRVVSGDLTSAFNFASPNAATVPLPSTVAYIPPDNNRHPDYSPVPPTDQAMPVQEPGTRPARAVPYELQVRGEADFSADSVKLHFRNSGDAGAVFQVYSGNSQNGPWTYTVGSGAEISDTWSLSASGQTAYDLSVYGPNGFLRTFKGNISGRKSANVDVRGSYEIERGGITLDIQNRGESVDKVRVVDAYTGKTVTHTLRPGEALSEFWRLESTFGWYNFTVTVDSDSSFQQQLAGHLETGRDSVTDPAIAAS